jgi:hypothetical protein
LLQSGSDAEAEFAGHADCLANFCDLQDSSLVDSINQRREGDAGGVSTGSDSHADAVGVLLAAADMSTVLEAKFGAPVVRTPDLSSLAGLQTGLVKGGPKASATQLQNGVAAAAAADEAGQGPATGEASSASCLAAEAACAAGNDSVAVLADGGTLEAAAAAAVHDTDQQDEVAALLVAAAEAVALEAKHGLGAGPTVAAADVAARLSALGVDSAAALEPQSLTQDASVAVSAEAGQSEGGAESEGEGHNGSSDRSNSSSSNSSGSYDSDEDEWVAELPAAPDHTVVQQQLQQQQQGSMIKARHGRRGPQGSGSSRRGTGSRRGRL